MELGNKRLEARLPKLGPQLGAVVEHTQDGPRVRLWSKADDACGGAPAAAVTVRWDKANHKLVTGSVCFWQIHVAVLPDTTPEITQFFAIAEVHPQIPDQNFVVRMAFIHELPGSRDAELAFEPPGMLALEPPHDSVRAIAGASAVPIQINELFVGDNAAMRALSSASGSAMSLKSAVEVLVQELFDQLEKDLADPDAIAPIPRTLSRANRRQASIGQCEVRMLAGQMPPGVELCFAAACCRHPGIVFDRGLSDRTLGALACLVEADRSPAFMVMLGDQIYADATAGVLDVGDRVEKYTSSYDWAFGSENFRRLGRCLPAYMLADDHEIRDGWPNDPLSQADSDGVHWDRSARWAWSSYVAHQHLHAPARPRWARPPIPCVRPSLWYAFEDRGFKFFAFDTRFERQHCGDRIVGHEQILAFTDWLNHLREVEQVSKEKDIPKFILSGSVFVPGLREFVDRSERSRHSDNWQAFADDQALISRLIAGSGLENFVFLSGDYHCAAVGSVQVHRRAASDLRGYAIVAPPLYAPFPFANCRNDDLAVQECIRDRWTGKDIATCKSEAVNAQGFALISVYRATGASGPDEWRIEVDLYEGEWDCRGKPEPHWKCKGLLDKGKARW
jgi:hypothetical protein